MTERIYGGDTVYGVFNSYDRAWDALQKVSKEIGDPDVLIKRVIINEFIKEGT